MFNNTQKSNRNLLFEWSQSNFLGWFLGGIGYIFVIALFANYYINATLFTGFFLLLPFGISVSVVQWLTLKRWKIQVPLLVPTTILGWSISTITVLTLVYIVNQYAQDNFPWAFSIINSPLGFLIICGTGSLIVGAGIGFFQSLSLRKLISRVDYWILTNALGYFSLVTLEAGIFVGAFEIKSWLLNTIYELGFWGLIELRWLLLFGFMLIALPFLATLTISIPTGRLFLKYAIPK
jgi:hypothetical protein